ncbi:MAG TPA: alpha,alpha-trehalase TreF [Saprospiraceae bacterium]|nr:alpha,alpha-trehalase TreF [Saprospiraceae bacterium]
MQPPDIIFGDLFKAVQSARIFPDSKTFVDCIPLYAPKEILSAFRIEGQKPDFNLYDFVNRNFALPKSYASDFRGDPTRPIEEHIKLLWNILRREADQGQEGSSLIPLSDPYIVPGGRFGEIYYWDSYFTILGLLESDRGDIAKDMLANFAHLIETIGHIPNGNRTYFLSRSQPPFFALMIREVGSHTGDSRLYKKYAPYIEQEYNFWMDFRSDSSKYPMAYRRAVELEPGVLMNRYWDDTDTPRQESYIEDVELAQKSDRNAAELYRDLRAACESGWDFSSRWCEDSMRLETIYTTSILPVDLNCLLWSMESFLAKTYEDDVAATKALHYQMLADRRKELISKYFWHAQGKLFRDFNFVAGYHTPTDSLATMYPLYMQIATEEQAQGVADAVHRFLKPGGLVPTLHRTGQQWDAPNGWAPLQWIAYQGLKNYGYEELANDIAQRWIDNVIRVYKNTGKLVEKYNVEDITLAAGGGEYPVQDGFGWTNGVFLALSKSGIEHRA